MAEIKRKKKNLDFPSEAPVSKRDLFKEIKEAENGEFYTSAQVKQALKKWSKKYSR